MSSLGKIAAFWLFLAAVPIAVLFAALGWLSYWSVPPFPMHVEGGSIISYDPEIGFIPTPNSSTTRTDSPTLSYHIYTDRRGARVSHPGDQSADKLDMLFIGDSFTWGHGVENEDTYAALVARRLHLASANLALASYGTTQALQMLRRNLHSQPRTVIYPIVTDHWRRNVSACAPTYYPFCLDCSYVTIGANGLPEIRAPATNGVRRTTLQIQYEKNGLSPDQWIVHGADVVLGRVLSSVAQSKASDRRLRTTAMEFLLSEMVKTTQGISASLVVVFIPARDETTLAPAQLSRLSELLGFRFLDVTRSMRANSTAPLYLPDGHPNRAGHELIAENIVDFLSGSN
jgi:lysophospholipase L1-like esterase